MSDITTLDELDFGQFATIHKVRGEGAIRRRLLDMGLTNGAQIELVRTSPLGDPKEFRLRGYNLSLRKEEAQFVQITMER